MWELKPEHSKAARYMLGWTSKDLSDKSGVPQNTISRFESGKSEPHFRTVRDLVRAFERAGVVWEQKTDDLPHVTCSDGVVVTVRTKQRRP